MSRAVSRGDGGTVSKKLSISCLRTRLVVLDGENVVGVPVDDRLCDLWIAGDGIDGDEGAGKGQLVEELRDCVLLAGGLADRLLSKHEALMGGKGGDQMQCFAAPPTVVAASRGFAVEGNKRRSTRPPLAGPSDEAGLEQLRIDAVHQRAQPIGAGQTVMIGEETAQERQMRLAPIDDVVIVVTSGNRAANHQQQDLRQRVRHAPLLARVAEMREMLQKAGEARLLNNGVHGRRAPNQIDSPRQSPSASIGNPR